MFPTTISEIAGQSVPALAQEYGTPLYVYDAAKIVERIRDLAPFDVVRYAQKASSNLAILDLVRRQSVLVDAVSAGEIVRALAAGYKPGQTGGQPEKANAAKHPDIVYTADLFDHAALELVIEHDLPVNCGSPDMIDQYGERCQKLGRERGITLRINPGFGHGHSQKTNTGGEGSKHGIWHTQVAECRDRAARYGLSISGLHMHIGSGTDMKHLSEVCGAMEQIAREVGPEVHSISAGGGLPTPYRGDEEPVDIGAYYELWDGVRTRLAEAWGHPVGLEIEPGRYLAAESGSLITEIRAIKQMGNNRYYLVDAGFNNLARPAMYGAYHPMAICTAEDNSASGKRQLPDAELQEIIVGGPLCESGDIFTQEEGGFVSKRELPEAQVGDLLVIGCAGAYGYTMGSNYNSKPLVAEVLIEEGQTHLIRKAQSLEELFQHESIPGSHAAPS